MPDNKLQLEQAYSRTEKFRINTPLIYSSFLSQRWRSEVYLKMEQHQVIGAFKIRGAANLMLQLSPTELQKGVVTHSSGNHAQAVAYMANKLGTKAFVVMPENSNKRKIELATKWGADITFCKPTIEDRIATSNALCKKHGASVVPPFDHEMIVYGQATAAMEMIAIVPDLDMICTPLGGGGLLSGSALASHYFGSKKIVVYGAEPKQASDGYTGFHAGKRETSVVANTIADGLRTTVGEVPFEFIKSHVEDIILAEEPDIIPWMYKIWEETKMIIEPSCAVPFAALDKSRHLMRNRKIGIVVTGGNVDLTQLPPYSPLES